MTIDELQEIEIAVTDALSAAFDAMADAGTAAWDLRKVALINAVMSELSNVVVEV